MKLTKNFSLKEFLKSTTAIRLDINNKPTMNEIKNLKILCEKVLQPIRDEVGAVTVTSGFRSLELNTALKSKPTSQHIKGEAADIEALSVSNYDLAVWIRDNLEFDQLILEFYDKDKPHAGWVHVSYSEGKNRGQCLTIDKSGVRIGLG